MLLRFTTPVALDLDITATVKLCRDLEETHGLRAVKGKIRPTGGYMRDLGRRLGCTPTQAWQVWLAVFTRTETLRRRHETESELAYWYKINPWTLTEEQQFTLTANLPRVQAQETLQRGDYDPTDYQYVYSIVLLATGDEKRAIRARGDAQEALINARSPRR